MNEDQKPSDELQSMIAIENALSNLSPDICARVIKWAADRFEVSQHVQEAPTQKSEEAGDPVEYETLAEFLEAANPKTGVERALIVGYWFQFIENVSGIKSAQVNSELKNLGYESSNITEAFNNLMGRKPALAVQVSKSGKSRQSRKVYKITQSGKTEVDKMIAGIHGDE